MIARNDKLSYLVECYRHEDISLMAAGGIGRADELLRRAAIFGRDIFSIDYAPRLMPLAREEILQRDGIGHDLPSGTVWHAKRLGRSKGRMSRLWWAPEGGIYLCIVLFPELSSSHTGLYSLAAGNAVADVIRLWGVDARTRWINDVLIDERKVAGVLAETVWCPDAGYEYILLGIGINVNIHEFPASLPCATSLAIETGNLWQISALCAHVIARLSLKFAELHLWDADNADHLLQGADAVVNPAVRDFRLLSGDIGREVLYGHDLEDSTIGIKCKVEDIRQDGSIMLGTEGGDELHANSGEIRYIRSDGLLC